MLEVVDLHCGYGKKEIVHGASFAMAKGEFTCILDANGCGKTTLLKNLPRLEKPFSGEVRLHGRNALRLTDQGRAKLFTYIPQTHTPPFPFAVADVVLLGRTPYLGRFSHIEEKDRQVAWDAMCTLGIEHLAPRTYTKLSGN